MKHYLLILLFIFTLPGLLPGITLAESNTSLEEQNETWFDAVNDGEIEKVQAMLNNGFDIETRLHGKKTALMIASKSGNLELVTLLIKHGADVDTQSKKHSTPLNPAAKRGYTKIVALLLENGASVDNRNRKGSTPLIQAAKNNHPEIAQLLINAGADLKARNAKNITPLLAASRGGSLEILQMLLSRKANPWEADMDGRNALQQSGTTSNMRDILMGTMNATSIVFEFSSAAIDDGRFTSAAKTAMTGRGWTVEQVSAKELYGTLLDDERIFKVHLQRIGNNLVIEYLPGLGSNKRHYLEFIKKDMFIALGLAEE